MTTTDRTGASEHEFRARIAPIEAAPVPDEVTAETVARALFAVTNPVDDWDEPSVPEHLRNHLRVLAAAAIAAKAKP